MRVDGRRNDELRDIKIIRHYIRYPEGSVLIASGFTKIICTATVVEDVPHFLKTEQQGWITAEYGMIPRSTPDRVNREAQKGKASGRTLEIQRLIGRSLRSCVDLKKLGRRTVLIDCDCIQADGGTRTAAITGSYVALYQAMHTLANMGIISSIPLKSGIAATSVGVVNGNILLDLCYEEDSKAEADFNVVMTSKGEFVEIQGTAETKPYSKDILNSVLSLAEKGIRQLFEMQEATIDQIRHL
jgi:ribonuclease PH